MRQLETISTRLDVNSVKKLRKIAELRKDYLQYVLQDILDKYLEEEETEAHRKSFEYTIQIKWDSSEGQDGGLPF